MTDFELLIIQYIRGGQARASIKQLRIWIEYHTAPNERSN
jgi:hypothetical protein